MGFNNPEKTRIAEGYTLVFQFYPLEFRERDLIVSTILKYYAILSYPVSFICALMCLMCILYLQGPNSHVSIKSHCWFCIQIFFLPEFN